MGHCSLHPACVFVDCMGQHQRVLHRDELGAQAADKHAVGQLAGMNMHLQPTVCNDAVLLCAAVCVW